MYTESLLLLISLLILTAAQPPTETKSDDTEDSASCRAYQILTGGTARDCKVGLSPTVHVPGESTEVNATIYITAVYGQDSREELRVGGYLYTTWNDPRLGWSLSDNDVNSISLPSQFVWKPDLGFWGNKDATVSEITRRQVSYVSVSWDGVVSAYADFNIHVACPLQMTQFPFDKQTCMIYVGPVSSTSSSFNFTLLEVLFPDQEIYFRATNNAHWFHSRSNWESRTWQGKGDSFVYYEILLEFNRRSIYYVNLVLLPCTVISLMASTMFLLRDPGDRIALSTCIALAMIIYVLVCTHAAPKSLESIPLLSIYLFIQMTILLTFTIGGVVLKPTNPEVKRKYTRNLFIAYFLTTGINIFTTLVIIPYGSAQR